MTGAYRSTPFEPEGPHNRSEAARTLVIEGTAGRVRTRCRIFAIDRRTAQKTLSAWSQKERARLLKKTLLGALDKDARRALKLAAHGDTDGAGSVTVTARYIGGARVVAGVPVSLPEMPLDAFVVHASLDKHGALMPDSWSVTEAYTGHTAGSGSSAEAAIVTARENMRKASPAAMAKVREQIDAARSAATSAAA